MTCMCRIPINVFILSNRFCVLFKKYQTMSLPWHIPLEELPSLREKPSQPQPTFLKHNCNLNIHSTPCEEVQTGLMCEISSRNREPSSIQRLIAAGLTIARLNMRDMEPEACDQLIQSVRQAVYNYSAELQYVYPLALIVDVRGPDIQTGDLKAGPKSTLELVTHATIRLTTDASWRKSGTSDCLFVGYDNLTDLQKGDAIFIDSLSPGKIKLEAVEIGDDSINCNIISGGMIGAKMSVRISKVPKEVDTSAEGNSKQSLSCSDNSQVAFEHIEEQIAWAVASDVDALLIPATQCAQDIKDVKNTLSDKGKHILVFGCIDTVLGLDRIDEIISEADGIYLDRCILATDLPVEKIFIAQKIIIAKCQEAGKSCICKAVINEHIPTLCVTDIANMVIEGVDVIALELFNNSPVKIYAQAHDALKISENCLGAAAVICRQAEKILWQPRVYGNVGLTGVPIDDPTKALCVSAAELSMRSNASAIICLTNSGRTAKILSQTQPYCPIVAVTRTCHTARQLRFWGGVRTVHYFEMGRTSWVAETDARIHAALDYCKAKRLIKAGDPYVVVSCSRKGTGYCDIVRLLYASAREIVPVL